DSLRSAFYSSDGKYVMRVLNETTEGFQLKFYNASNPNVSKEALKRFLAFEDHEFNVSQGPLFCTRLARLGEVEHILVMKLHHVIFDTWSLAVLQRDLLVAYAAFNSGEKPNLPELKFQYGDYMCLDNQYRENNLIRDKSYWQKRYTMLPKELILRGEKKRKALDVGLRFCKRIVFTMPTESYAKIIRWSRKHSASLFIVMIAALKSYLGKVTGQNDIILGTQVFGRENHVGLESQIGFYSRMNLLRTVLPEHNTIDRAITSAKKSYEEMQVYTAFSLMDHIEAMLPEGQHITGTFWKIHVQYEDAHGYIDQTAMPTLPGLQITQIREDNPLKLHNIDLRFDFFNQNGKIQIAVDYNVDLYDEQLIRTFIE